MIFYGDPLTLNVVQEYPNAGAEILLYTNQAVNIYYYKYTIGGMNVVLLSILIFFVNTIIGLLPYKIFYLLLCCLWYLDTCWKM